MARIIYARKSIYAAIESRPRTPLHGAVDPHRTDLYGRTRLNRAVEKGYKDVVKILIGGGADPNKTDLNGNTVVNSASESGHKDLVQILLDCGAAEPGEKSEDMAPREKGDARRMKKYLGKRGQRKDRRDTTHDATYKRYEKYQYDYEYDF